MKKIKFRFFNTDNGVTSIFTLSKLIGTTFRRGKFEFRGRFTGLKDKNGVDIYEGDIILYEGCDMYGGDMTVVVKYNELKGYSFNKISVGEKLIHCDLEYNIKCKVIGNIYENPDLITNQ